MISCELREINHILKKSAVFAPEFKGIAMLSRKSGAGRASLLGEPDMPAHPNAVSQGSWSWFEPVREATKG